MCKVRTRLDLIYAIKYFYNILSPRPDTESTRANVDEYAYHCIYIYIFLFFTFVSEG